MELPIRKRFLRILQSRLHQKCDKPSRGARPLGRVDRVVLHVVAPDPRERLRQRLGILSAAEPLEVRRVVSLFLSWLSLSPAPREEVVRQRPP